MNKKILLLMITALLIVGAGFFFLGKQFGQETGGGFSGMPNQGFSGFSSEQLSDSSPENMKGNVSFNRLTGEVTDKDGESLVLKVTASESRIIFYSDSTTVSKTITGSIEDVAIGAQIAVSAEENEDGSYTAKTIQLTPAE